MVSIVVGCKNRQSILNQSIASWLLLNIQEIVVVDWNSSVPVFFENHDPRIKIKRVVNVEQWNLSLSLNFAIREAKGPLILKLDTDYILKPDFFQHHPLQENDRFFYTGNWKLARNENERHLNGLVFVSKHHLNLIGSYSELLNSYGWDDSDLYHRLQKLGIEQKSIQNDDVYHIPHLHKDNSKLQIMKNKFLCETLPWSNHSPKAIFVPKRGKPGCYRFLPTLFSPVTQEVLDECERKAILSVLHDDHGFSWSCTWKKDITLLRSMVSRPPQGRIIIEPLNGLGNRLRALASAQVVANELNRNLCVVWNRDNHCLAPFEKLFQTNGLIVFDKREDLFRNTNIKNEEVLFYTPGKAMVLETAPLKPLKETPSFNVGPDNNSSVVTMSPWNQTQKDIWVSSACVIPFPYSSWSKESKQLQQLSLVPKLQSQIDFWSNEFNIHECVGVHIRMGQHHDKNASYEDFTNWDEKVSRQLIHHRHASHLQFFLRKMKSCDDRIFLCADRESTFDFLKQEIPKERLCYIPQASFDRSVNQIESAVLDAYLLSKTRAVWGSPWSSFTELAARLGGPKTFIAGTDFAKKTYAAFCHSDSVNLGDTIQSLAVCQFFPQETPHYWIERDHVAKGLFDGEGNKLEDWSTVDGPVQVVFNGWFDGRLMNLEQDFPEQMSPLILSFHLNESHTVLTDPKYEKLVGSKGLLKQSLLTKSSFFKDHAPILCRDQHTCSLFEKQNIKALVSGCVTLLLNKKLYEDKRMEEKDKKILIVDTHILYPKLLKQLVPNDVMDKAEMMSNVVKEGLNQNEKVLLAKQTLKRFANAKYVITSRIHSAFPSLAFGVPVFFIFPEKELEGDVRFDADIKQLLQNDRWNWDSGSISLKQMEVLTKFRNELQWRVEHFVGLSKS